MLSPSRREVIHSGLAAVTVGVPTLASAADQPELTGFHFDHILGTSLDVWMQGDAQRAEPAVLAEIERLRAIFSVHDSESELSRLNRSSGPVSVSRELADVLNRYRAWHRHTAGACSAEVGSLVQLWQAAERSGVEPDAATLATWAARLRQPGWSLHDATRTVTRGDAMLNLNAIAKGTILDRIGQVMQPNAPVGAAWMVNLGGDIRVQGNESATTSGWRIGIQDPAHPAENARPLTVVRLIDQAIATSGGYQRFFTLAGQRRSHLIDPRTGYPAEGVASATVVAPNSTLANTLATTLCVLSPAEGLRLIAATPGTACLIVTATGDRFRSEGFAALELPGLPVALQEPAQPANAWPADRQVQIALELPRPTTGKAIRRPYVSVWIEDGDGKALRTLAVWGNSPKWINTLTNWWKFARNDAALVKANSRATRGPGKYEIVWDGKNDAGQPVPQGTYTIKVEVHREHGKHLVQTGKIDCKADDAKVTLDRNDETAATVVQYAKKN